MQVLIPDPRDYDDMQVLIEDVHFLNEGTIRAVNFMGVQSLVGLLIGYIFQLPL